MSNFKNGLRYIKMKLKHGITGNDREVLVEKSDVEKTGTSDPNMLCFEVYNKGKARIMYVETLQPKFGGLDRTIVVKPGEWMLIPHRYFTVYSEDGNPVFVTENFGDMKFKGNKQGVMFK